MAKKCLDKRVQCKQIFKHNLGNRTNRWSKVQAEACCPSGKKQVKQQKQKKKKKG